MTYAKINIDGTILEFPYHLPHIFLIPSDQTLPEDIVKVDTETNLPVATWKQVAMFDSVVKTGEIYAVTYTIVDRFADDTAIVKGITNLKKQHEGTNERTFTFKAKQLLSIYPDVERETWAQQNQEAAAYQADNSVATPLLTAIATARNITVAELTVKVLAKAEEYAVQYGALLGAYQANRQILASIDLNDNTTWDLIETIVRV